MLFITFAEDGSDIVPYEDAIEMRLEVRVSVGPQVSIVQDLPVLAAALGVPALVNVFFEEGGEVKLILLLGHVHVAMPVEHSERSDLVLTFRFLVYHRCFHNVVSIHHEEFPQEHRKRQDKDQDVVFDDGIGG